MTYPLLVVKSRLQAANKDTHADLKYTGAVDAVTRIWKHEGEQPPLHCMKGALVPRDCDLESTAAAVCGCSPAQPLQMMQLRVGVQQVPGRNACKVLDAWHPLLGSGTVQAGNTTSTVVATSHQIRLSSELAKRGMPYPGSDLECSLGATLGVMDWCASLLWQLPGSDSQALCFALPTHLLKLPRCCCRLLCLLRRHARQDAAERAGSRAAEQHSGEAQ